MQDVVLLTRPPHDLELLSRWRTKLNTFLIVWGNFITTKEDVARLILLPMFRDGIVLKGEDHVKLKYLVLQ